MSLPFRTVQDAVGDLQYGFDVRVFSRVLVDIARKIFGTFPGFGVSVSNCIGSCASCFVVSFAGKNPYLEHFLIWWIRVRILVDSALSVV